MIIVGCTGFLFTLLVGGGGLGYYLYTHRTAANGGGERGNGTGDEEASGGGSSEVKREPNGGGFAGAKTTDPDPRRRDPAPGDKTDEPAKPVNPDLASVLGKDGEPDRLDTPYQLPAGILPFMQGLDLIEAMRPLEAVPCLNQAIEANPNKGAFYAVRGAAYVVAQRPQDGIQDLQRAFNMNESKNGAGRLLCLAYLMSGDERSAAGYRTRNMQRSDIDYMFDEVGGAIGRYVQARQGKYRSAPNEQEKYDVAVKKLPLVAKLVASTYRSDDEDSVHALFALGVEQLRNREFAAAKRGFRSVLAKYPLDWTSRYYYARALMETGDPELARRELTWVLCWKRFLPEAYAARAICAARQNDAARAQSDLVIAKKLDPAKATEAEAEVVKLQMAPAPAGAAKDAQDIDALLQLARGSMSFDELAARCVELKQSVDARRRRWDEIYQMNVYERCADARAHRGDAERLARAADFIWDNRDVRGISISTNGATQYFRRQTQDSAKLETSLVVKLADEGLNFDPRNGHCWAIKAVALLVLNSDLEGATAAAERAVDYAPKLPQAYFALSDCFGERAARLRQKAAALRTPRTGTRNVVDQRGNYLRSESYSIPPSAGDLAQAEVCDREAAECEAREQKCFEAAAECSKGTAQEAFCQAYLYYERKDYQNARAWMEKAVQANPDNYKYPFALANFIQKTATMDEYIEAFARAIDRQETTATVWLRVAWESAEKKDWEAVRRALARARMLDPSDARIMAFMGVLSEYGDRDGSAAEGCFRTALVQEEARARSNRSTLLPGGTTPLTIEDAGLTIMLRLRTARYAFARAPATAAEYYLATVAMEPRISDWNLIGDVKLGMLPNPDRAPKDIPQAMPLVAVLKNNRIFAAQALINAGHDAEAAPHIREAENYINRLPAGGTVAVEFELEPAYVPFRVSSMPHYIKLLNAQLLLQEGKKDVAYRLLVEVRYYLANRLRAQREMKDDPIPGMYERMAPQVGLR